MGLLNNNNNNNNDNDNNDDDDDDDDDDDNNNNIVHFYGAVCRASEAPRFSVQRYFEEVSLQLALEEFKRRLRPNDGGKVVPDGRRGIGEASIDDG